MYTTFETARLLRWYAPLLRHHYYDIRTDHGDDGGIGVYFVDVAYNQEYKWFADLDSLHAYLRSRAIVFRAFSDIRSNLKLSWLNSPDPGANSLPFGCHAGQ